MLSDRVAWHGLSSSPVTLYFMYFYHLLAANGLAELWLRGAGAEYQLCNLCAYKCSTIQGEASTIVLHALMNK